MDKFKKIATTLAVILFTALLVYNTQRQVPSNEIEYANYAYSYWLYNYFCMALFIVVTNIGYTNRIHTSCYIINFSICLSMMWKAYNRTILDNNYYDITLIGMASILSFIYLLKPYSKDLLLLCKVTINQIYALCQRTKPKGK